MKGDYIRVVKCPVCGKNFVPAGQHIYRFNDKLVCSWGCQRTEEKKRDAKKKKKGGAAK